jgi:hypothetical protein
METDRLTSGGFSSRDALTQSLISTLKSRVLTLDRYFIIETGIEHRFGDKAEEVHSILYAKMGPTTDLLRYFPDALLFDRLLRLPTWSATGTSAERLAAPADLTAQGLFTFFAEFKTSATMRRKSIKGVPSEYIGQIEREAWLTYRRLTSPNPHIQTYLDGLRSRITVFYAASYAPDRLYAAWEQALDPIDIKHEVAEPASRSYATAGSGTPWVNFDIRQMKVLPSFLNEDLYWNLPEAKAAYEACCADLYGAR